MNLPKTWPVTLADNYAEAHTSALPAYLKEVLDYTLQHHPHSHMISGAVQGQFLRMLSFMIAPRRVLEIGTFTGFSALCLAAGLPEDGHLITLELREEDATRAKSFFGASPFADKITCITGEAARVIPTLEEQWDLVFIDADKTGYSHYLDLVWPLVNPGGWVLADNVLFHGEVLEADIRGKNAKAIDAFNKKTTTLPDADITLLTIRDGLLLIRKNQSGTAT